MTNPLSNSSMGTPAKVVEINTLERILVNALEHFSKYGYLGASVREITESAHVTKPTLYYYFRNKEELYRGLANTCFDKLTDALNGGAASQGTLEQRFSAFVEAYYQFCDRELPAARFVHLISFSPSRDVPDVGVQEVNKRVAGLIGNLVREAAQAGEVDQSKVECVQLLLEGLYTMAVDRKLSGYPLDLDHVRRSVSCTVTASGK
jgi:AcrR family transcriptional regulator